MQENFQTHEIIVQKLKSLVAKEKEVTLSILHLLKQVENGKIDLARGHASLFKFCIQELGYSEAEALLRIRAMRLLKSMPEVEVQIQTGLLSISNVAEVQNQFRRENERRKKLSIKPLELTEKKDVLCKIEKLSVRECQRTLATTFPEIQTVVTEKTRVLRDDKTLIQFSASKDLFLKLEKLKGLLAHKYFDGTYETLFEELANIALKKLDPLQKHRVIKNDSQNSSENDAKAGSKKDSIFEDGVGVGSKSIHAKTHQKLQSQTATDAPLPLAPRATRGRSRYVPTQLRRKIWLKADSRCEYVCLQTGNRCNSNHALEIDHIHELSRGGKTEAGNLRLLCDAHNRWRYKIDSRS